MAARLSDLACMIVHLGRVEADYARQSLAMGKPRVCTHERIGNLGRLDAAAACALRDVILRPLLSGPAKRQQELVLAGGATLFDG